MIIRQADAHDLPVLLQMAAAMHAESPAYNSIEFDKAMTECFLEFVVEGDDYIKLVAEKDGQIIGALLGHISCFFFSPKKRACDIAFYIYPAHRGSMAAPKLISAYENEAQGRGCGHSYLGVSTAHKGAGAFYERIGYTNCGTCYMKEL